VRWLRAAGDDVDEGLSGREAADWCGSGVTVREVTRLRRLVHSDSGRGTRLTRGAPVQRVGRPPCVGLPRVFRTVELVLFHAAGCSFKYSMRTLCGVR
jgi:hypothetical protein